MSLLLLLLLLLLDKTGTTSVGGILRCGRPSIAGLTDLTCRCLGAVTLRRTDLGQGPNPRDNTPVHPLPPPRHAGLHNQRRGRETEPGGAGRAGRRGRRGVLLEELGRGEF